MSVVYRGIDIAIDNKIAASLWFRFNLNTKLKHFVGAKYGYALFSTGQYFMRFAFKRHQY